MERWSFWFLNRMRKKYPPEVVWEQRKNEIKSFGIEPGQRILDVGCGVGDWAILFKKMAGKNGYVAGIAPTAYFIEASKKNAQAAGVEVDFRLGNMETLQFDDNSFDIVTCFAVMMNVQDPDKMAGLKDMFRVLKPGRKMIVYDLAKPPKSLMLPVNFWFYRMIYGVFGKIFWQGKFQQMMEKAGFTSLEQTTPQRMDPMWLCYYMGVKPIDKGS